MPGLPAVITELARWVKPRDARSTQSPSRAVSIAGQAPTMTRWRSSTDRARCGLPRREGDGGTSLTAVTAPRGTRTSPRRVRTTRMPSSSATSSPTASVRVAPVRGSGALEPVPHDDPRTDPRVTIRPDLRCVHGPHSMSAMTYVIAQPCVDLKDKACIEECPVDCIYEGERSLYIHPDECVDCGACEPVCPVEAIYYEDDVPEQWADYYKANVEFFDDLGSPGGAAKLGVIPKDHPIIADLPPQEHDE